MQILKFLMKGRHAAKREMRKLLIDKLRNPTERNIRRISLKGK